MSHNSADRLVKMANQIGKFFAAQRHSDAVAGTAEHLKKFWDPRMRAGIIDHVAQGGSGLDEVPLQAVQKLAAK
ncbi:NAD-dependent formate dehydrogenase [Methylosinus sp. C49]|uniref:formate dehydrogenase subunit delta n=1 Tax=Methylosinus sp. C49 TaxID=2699395 RepID=UPI001367847E|nr:formate dehydrogenase subunit delta [Methylosinus sp. C49]BBU62226.1 NAD-dependent formate dehydrogenase [Methylosinus sp. C49]